LKLFQNFSFWNSFPRFKGKTGAFDRFFQEPVPKPRALAHRQLVLEQAQLIIKIRKILTNRLKWPVLAAKEKAAPHKFGFVGQGIVSSFWRHAALNVPDMPRGRAQDTCGRRALYAP
jgi:hypothetical protein